MSIANVSTKLCVVCGKSEASSKSTKGWCVECMRTRHTQKEAQAYHKKLHVFGGADKKITQARVNDIFDFLSVDDAALLALRVTEVHSLIGAMKAKEAILAKAIQGLSK